MSQLPASAPEKAGEAFAHINAVISPTLDDLKLMVFLEASGLAAYYELAESAPNAEVRSLLEANGREELAHAHRVSKVIKILSGEDFPPPNAEDNRYVGPICWITSSRPRTTARRYIKPGPTTSATPRRRNFCARTARKSCAMASARSRRRNCCLPEFRRLRAVYRGSCTSTYTLMRSYARSAKKRSAPRSFASGDPVWSRCPAPTLN